MIVYFAIRCYTLETGI